MKPAEIREGATYEGKDGSRRRVTRIHHGAVTWKPWLDWVAVDKRPHQPERGDMNISGFAHWAVREMTTEPGAQAPLGANGGMMSRCESSTHVCAKYPDCAGCTTRTAAREVAHLAALRSRCAEVEAERDEALRHLRAVLPICDERVRHIYQGLCPTDVEGTGNRDPECPACQALTAAVAFLAAQKGD